MADQLDHRGRSVRALHDFSRGRGVEIGPLFAPQLGRDEADVTYLDVVSTAELREYYVDDPRVDESAIVDVDHALTSDGVIRSVAETLADVAPLDWLFASHVIEHVPDVIGWLEDLAAVVRPGGSLVLVVPDKRFTFDLHRPPTTVGAMIQAHRDGDSIASIRAVYDHFREALTVDSADLWHQRQPAHPERIYSDDEATTYIAKHGVSHVDPHVWIFTPDLFLLQMNELRRRGLSDWYVDGFEPTAPDQLEFYVRMRRLDAEQRAAGTLADEVVPEDDRPHWMIDAAASAARLAELESQLIRVQNRLRRQRRRSRRLQTRLNAVENSRRWRIASAFARPLRLLRRP